MLKITKEENDRLEDELETYHKEMSSIDDLLGKIEAGEYDAEQGEMEARKIALLALYKDIEDKAFNTAKTLNNSFVSEKWHDDAAFDYQLTEMKA